MTSQTRTETEKASEAAGLKWVLLAALAVAMAVDASGQQAPEPELRIVVSLVDRKLLLLADDQPLKVYPVAVGKSATPTPIGEFTVVNRLVEPTYYHPGVVIPPGPDNPLGSRWMGLNAKSYGIHGTNDESSIGLAASTGCVRMARADLEELFEVVRPGTKVQIVTAPEGELAELLRRQ